MAWREFSELSIADQLHENKRQAMIVAQNALGHATDMVMGLGGVGLDKFTLETTKQRVKETAEDLTYWVYAQAEILTTPKEQALGVLPTPTADQFKVLKAIAIKLNKEIDNDLKSNVLKWSVTNPNVLHPTYPSRIESVDKFVKWCEEK